MSEEKTTKSGGPAFNTQPAGLEKGLANFYSKTVTLNLPTGGRKWLADNVWWIALIGGLVSLWGAWGMWQATQAVNYWGLAYGVLPGAATYGFMWYVILAVIALEAVLLLFAISKLKSHQKSGWNLLYYVSLLGLVTGVAYLFVPYYGGVGSLLGAAIGALIGWFFLFQIRGYFKS